jgi:hypothetical protein
MSHSIFRQTALRVVVAVLSFRQHVEASPTATPCRYAFYPLRPEVAEWDTTDRPPALFNAGRCCGCEKVGGTILHRTPLCGSAARDWRSFDNSAFRPGCATTRRTFSPCPCF